MHIPVPQHLTNGWSVIREDWRVALWTAVVAGIASLASAIVLVPMITIGFAAVGAISTAESMALTVAMGVILGGTFLIALFGVGIAVQSVLRAGVIGVLRARKPGMVTDFGTYWAYARTGFKTQFRAHAPGWVLWIPYFLVLFGVLAAIFFLSGGAEAFERQGDEGVVAVVLMMIGFFGMSLLLLPLQLVITYGTKYGAYVMHDNPSQGGWAAFRKGLRFAAKNFWAVVGLSLLFLLVYFGISVAVQVVSIPASLLGAIPLIGAILSIPISLGLVLISAAVQSVVLVWEEQASLNLYDDRKEAM